MPDKDLKAGRDDCRRLLRHRSARRIALENQTGERDRFIATISLPAAEHEVYSKTGYCGPNVAMPPYHQQNNAQDIIGQSGHRSDCVKYQRLHFRMERPSVNWPDNLRSGRTEQMKYRADPPGHIANPLQRRRRFSLRVIAPGVLLRKR